MNRILWILQGLLALLFLFAGAMKFVTPVEQMNAQSAVKFSGAFLHFIGICEVLGAIGLILPGLLGIKPGLTPLAAAGLVLLMLGAVVISLAGGTLTPALFPLLVGILLTFVAHRRWSALAAVKPG
jgi:hypothetical protein